jgi:hypothetical protein
MPGVPKELIEHSLNVDPKATPKRQHLRRFTDDRRDAIKKELAKLLAAGFMLTVKIRQPSHEFTFGVGMNFIPYPLVLTPVV